MATSAAPTYFPSYYIDNMGYFIDGGCHQNNPSLLAYSEALRYQIPKDNIFLLSLGTGNYIPDPLDSSYISRGTLFWILNFHKVALSA